MGFHLCEGRRAVRVLLTLSVLTTACAGGKDRGTATEPSPALTLTITAAGVSPKSLDVYAGGQVTFVNNDLVPHTMFSNPHPEHTDCPALNQVGFLGPGETRQSGNLNAAETCEFHDEGSPFDESLQGSITIR